MSKVLLDTSLEKYFNDCYDMFGTDGWATLVGDLRANAVNVNSVEYTTDADNLHFRKGQLAILGTLFNLETQIDSSQQQALESKEDEDVEQDEII